MAISKIDAVALGTINTLQGFRASLIKGEGVAGRELDLISMGRAILDVYGEQVGCRLEEVTSFAKYVGGCPANIAIGAARLGLKVAMITRVGDEQHGRFLCEQLERESVDVSHVRIDPDRPTGVAFLGIRDKETFPLLHYRENCADMAILPEDYSADFIGQARALLVSGSHLTTRHAAANIAAAIEYARAKSTRIIFDIDYRPLFWGLAHRDAGESRFVESSEVTAASQRFLPFCDLVVGTEEEIRITGGAADTIGALREIRRHTEAVIVLKRGPRGCVAFEGEIPSIVDEGLVAPGFPVDVFNVVGAGDGFMGGLLYGWLRDKPLAECCRYGNACGALVVSRHGCSPAAPTEEELDWFLRRGAGPTDLFRDRRLARLHRTTTRRARPASLQIIDCDDRLGLDSVACAPERSLSALKSLVAQLALDLREAYPGIGVIFDHAEGEKALYRSGSAIAWVGRRMEIPGRRPLSFEDELPAGIALRSWPTHHIVKCLVPQITESQRAIQEERLRELYLACQHYGHELLLQFDADAGANGIADMIRRIRVLHDLGILPDWLRVSTFATPEGWSELAETVAQANPDCRGILVDGGDRSLQALSEALKSMPRLPLIKGFSVGHAVLADPASSWLRGEATDEELAADLRKRFVQLAESWTCRC